MSLYSSITAKLHIAKRKLEDVLATLILLSNEKQREYIDMETAIQKTAEKGAGKEQNDNDQQQAPKKLAMVMKAGLVLKTASHLEDRDDNEYGDAFLSTAELSEGTCPVSDEDWVLVQKPFGR
ncbi:hypothetical protein ACHAQA_006974 [Verticillium albo-atrum]